MPEFAVEKPKCQGRSDVYRILCVLMFCKNVQDNFWKKRSRLLLIYYIERNMSKKKKLNMYFLTIKKTTNFIISS